MLKSLAQCVLCVTLLTIVLSANAESNQLSSKAEFDALSAQYIEAMKSGDSQVAHSSALRLYELGKGLYEVNSDMRIALAHNLGNVYRGDYNRAQGLPYLKEALEQAEASYGEDGARLIPILRDYGQAMIVPYKRGPEMRIFSRAVGICNKHSGKNSLECANLNILIGLGITHMANTLEGRKFIDRGLAILEKLGDESSLDYGVAMYGKGRYLMMSSKHQYALPYLEKALAVLSSYDSATELLLSVHHTLVAHYHNENQPELATEHALAIGRAHAGRPKAERLPIYRAAPTYPAVMLQMGQGGWVELLLDVDESGFTRNIRVSESSDNGAFDKAAVKAASKYRYAPLIEDGVAVVNKDVPIRIVFELEG